MSLFLAVVLLAVMADGMAGATNIVVNPGFEDRTQWEDWPRPWWAENEGRNWSRENTVSHSGTWSFKVTYPTAQPHNLAGQGITVTGGEFYQVGAWIKTQNVTGDGATIRIEWLRQDGGYLGGEYGFPRVSGTRDWQFISLSQVQAPATATRAIIYLELTDGSAGTAWYDDAIVEKCIRAALSSFILRPNYAYKILPDAPSPEIEAEVTVSLEDGDSSLDQVKIVATLKDQNGSTVVHKNVDPLPSSTFTVSLDMPAGAPAGNYDLDIALFAKSGGQLAQNAYSMDKLSQVQFASLTSYIDSHNRFILNGEPFFPIGIYLGVEPQWGYSQADEIADSPFDTIINYAINAGNTSQITGYLDYLHSKGLKLIYSLKDETDLTIISQKVTAFKGHPAIISWYMNDERGLEFLPELEAGYQKVRELDENHPIWSVHWQQTSLVGEAHTTDILGVDPYPIPASPITLVSDMADWAKDAGRGYRPLWLVPQIFDQSNYDRPGRLPTPEEMRAMTYLATNHGARGLVYYSYFDIRSKPYYQTHWAAVKKIASEIKSLRPVFLSLEKTGENDIVCSNTSIDCKLMKNGNSYYLFAVNTLQQDITSASFQINLAYRPAIINTEFEDGRQIEATNGRFTDDFSPYEVHIYQFDRPTLIELGKFTATPQSDRIIITFSTLSETNTAGFNLLRSEEENGEYVRINPHIIEARGGVTQGSDYSYADTAVSRGITYYYKLEEKDTGGGSALYGPVSAALPADRPSGGSSGSCFVLLPYFWPRPPAAWPFSWLSPRSFPHHPHPLWWGKPSEH
ncbi:MAG: hypothetical protein AB1611_19975 [bacterium]